MGLNELDRVGVVVGDPAEAVQTPGWQIVDGLPQKYWAQLVEYSTTDPVIAEFTSDPERFKDVPSVEKWLKKGRDVYTVTDPTGEKLLGLYWFGPEAIHVDKPGEKFTFTEEIDIEDYPITNARRLYGPLRGAGQSSAIFKEVFGRFVQTETFKQSRGGVWTETSGHNERVIRVDIAHGFRQVTEINGRGKIILVADKAVLFDRVRASSVPAQRSGR